MSFTDALSRIAQIQSDIAQVSELDAATSATAPASTTAASSTSGASLANDFTTQLASASSSTPTSASSSALVQNGATGADVVSDAEKYLGVPYVFGGTTTSGMDCSGLVQTVFKDLGITMPRTVGPQSEMGQTVDSLADAQPGDLIVEKGDGHIQIYAGNGMIIEAPKPGENVVERKEWLSSDEIGTIRRIVPSTSADTTASTASTPSVSSGTTAQEAALASQIAALSGGTSSGSSSNESALMSLLSGSGSSTSGSTESSLLSSLEGTSGSSSSTSSLASLLSQSGQYSSLAAVLGGSL